MSIKKTKKKILTVLSEQVPANANGGLLGEKRRTKSHHTRARP